MGAKRRRLQDQLADAEQRADRRQEQIDHLRNEVATLRARPTVAKLPEGDEEVYTVMIEDISVMQDALPIPRGGYVELIPGLIRISMVCTGPQPKSNTYEMMGGKFALVPVTRDGPAA